MSLSPFLLVLGCGGSQAEPQAPPQQLQCTIDGQAEMRVMRDCASELSYQERDLSARVEAFGVGLGGSATVQFRPVQDSLMMLLEQQRSMCRDWNACALSRTEYVQRSEWMTSQFTTLTQLLDAASPGTMQDAGARERIVAQVLDWAQRAREMQVQERIETQRLDIEAQRVGVEAQANQIEAQRTDLAAQSAMAETSQAGSQQRIATAAELQAQALRDAAEAQRRALEGQSAAMAKGQSQASVQMRLQIQQMERDNAELRAFLDLLGQIRTGTEGAAEGRTPRACGNQAARSKLRELAVGGASVGSQAGSIRDKLDDLCGRFERWAQPNDVARRSIQGFFQHLTQIEGFMNDAIRCARISDARGRADCERGIGETGAADEAAEQAGLRAVAEVRRELPGVEQGRRPFPCFSESWVRVAALQFTGGRARIWVPGIPRQAQNVCSAIGVDTERLGDVMRGLVGILDSAESSARGRIRTNDDNIVRFRAMGG